MILIYIASLTVFFSPKGKWAIDYCICYVVIVVIGTIKKHKWLTIAYCNSSINVNGVVFFQWLPLSFLGASFWMVFTKKWDASSSNYLQKGNFFLLGNLRNNVPVVFQIVPFGYAYHHVFHTQSLNFSVTSFSVAKKETSTWKLNNNKKIWKVTCC